MNLHKGKKIRGLICRKALAVTGVLLILSVIGGCSIAGKPVRPGSRHPGTGISYPSGLTQNVIRNALENKVKSGNIHPLFRGNAGMLLREVRMLGLNCVSVPVLVEAKNNTSTEMRINGRSRRRAVRIIKMLEREGIDFMLEPYPWIGGGRYCETTWEPEDKHEWFANWKAVLVDLAESVAIPHNAYAMVTASNYIGMELGYHDEWLDIFNGLRALEGFDALVTYRTNFWVTADWAEETKTAYENKLSNPLFGELDFISIAFYFELNNGEAVPSVEMLKADLRSVSKFNRGQDIYTEIKNFHDKHGKPVFFGELGAPRREYAASEPWNPEPGRYMHGESAVFSEEAQANYFQAVLETFGNEEWFLGMGIFAIGNKDSSYSVIPK